MTSPNIFASARGQRATMQWREGTADFNNLRSCLDEDEYALRSVFVEGVAVDVGAHIGGVTVSLALDNPKARVIAVEALSANVDVLRENVAANELSNVTVLHVAAAAPGTKKATIRWNFADDESGQHHRFIGNSTLNQGGEAETVDCIDLAGLVKLAGGHIDFMKIDVEGAEYDLFSKGAKDVGEIRGEFHRSFPELVALLGDTHHVRLTSGTDAFGGFEASPK